MVSCEFKLCMGDESLEIQRNLLLTFHCPSQVAQQFIQKFDGTIIGTCVGAY